jgi:hypothetical protein
MIYKNIGERIALSCRILQIYIKIVIYRWDSKVIECKKRIKLTKNKI